MKQYHRTICAVTNILGTVHTYDTRAALQLNDLLTTQHARVNFCFFIVISRSVIRHDGGLDDCFTLLPEA